MRRKFVFVYNADSGFFNTVTDIAHKILSPKTYSCNLCALTHGHFSVRDVWVKYLKESDAQFEFLHKDEFVQSHAEFKAQQLPAIFDASEEPLKLIFDAQRINQINDLEQLIDLMREA